MLFLADALNRIETWLVRNQPQFALNLQPGLTRTEIDEITKGFPFHLPQELYEFYGWHNGCTDIVFYPSPGYIVPFYEKFFPLEKVEKDKM